MAIEDLRERFTALQADLPANPIIDELQDLFDEADTELCSLRKDRERLDWLEAQATPGLVWEARQSRTGRGYRLHQHSSEYLGDAVDTGATARSAIDAAMAQEGER